MRKLLVGLAALALTLSLGMTAALAESPSQTECEANDGSFSRDGGTVTCTYTVEEPVGNSGKPWNGHSQQTNTSSGDSSNGTLNNEPQAEPLPEECTGPPGQCK